VRGRRRADWQTRRKIRSGWKWGELRAAVHIRDRACVRCGSPSAHLEVHHVVPLACGGSNRLENLDLVCRPCHAEPTAKSHETIGRAETRRKRRGNVDAHDHLTEAGAAVIHARRQPRNRSMDAGTYWAGQGRSSGSSGVFGLIAPHSMPA
jgi:5-methylcytosine-specific restriction endonuclease McrA